MQPANRHSLEKKNKNSVSFLIPVEIIDKNS